MFLSLLGLLHVYLDLEVIFYKLKNRLKVWIAILAEHCYIWLSWKNRVLYGFHLKWMLQPVNLTFQSFLCNLENIWAILKITRKLVHKIELSCSYKSFVFTYTLDHFSSDIKNDYKYN